MTKKSTMESLAKHAVIKQIRHSFLITMGVDILLVGFIWYLLAVPLQTALRGLIVLGMPTVIAFVFMTGYALKGVLALIDAVNPRIVESRIKVSDVVIEGYIGCRSRYVIGRVYDCNSNTKWKRLTPYRDCFAFGHDIELLGMPQYLKDHTYLLTYLKRSKIIISIEDVSGDGQLPIQCKATNYAQSILTKNDRNLGEKD